MRPPSPPESPRASRSWACAATKSWSSLFQVEDVVHRVPRVDPDGATDLGNLEEHLEVADRLLCPWAEHRVHRQPLGVITLPAGDDIECVLEGLDRPDRVREDAGATPTGVRRPPSQVRVELEPVPLRRVG